MFDKINKELKTKSSAKRAKASAWYFKTGKGEYAEGDKFLGLKMADQRKIAKNFAFLISVKDIVKFLQSSKFHEQRMVALLMLCLKYKKADPIEQKEIFTAYLANTRFVNNWDLVDITCRDIVGCYLFNKNRKVLYNLALSKNLWERRIAIISTFYFISKNELADTFKIAKILLCDQHDLIHKAVGWALREAGKKDVKMLKEFLNEHVSKMPRTMLRYAIEKFPKAERKRYLSLPR